MTEMLSQAATTRAESSTQSQAINVEDVAVALSDMGLAPDVIAYVLNAPVGAISGHLSVRRNIRSPEEEQLAEGMRRLAQAAIKESFKILTFGPTEQKLAIIKAMLASGQRLIGTDSSGSTQEARIAFEELLANMRQAPVTRPVVTPTGIRDVAIDSASFPTDH